MSCNFEYEVPEALGQLLKTETDYNVIIHIGKNPNFKEFHAHFNILHCRSEYFNKILSDKNIEKKDGKYIIKKPNFSPQAFEIILKYLYTGQFNITNKTGTELLDFMIVSDELMLGTLTKITEAFIFNNYQQFLRNEPVEILQMIYYCKPLINLQEFWLNIICIEPKILFNSDKFVQLCAPLLEIILKRDDLNLEEIEIWENLIKWGLAQVRILNQDITKWNQDDVNIFKKILHKFIPLIRYYDISTRDYFNRIKPYEEILPKELRDDILKSYMIPEYKPIYTPRRPKYLKYKKNNFDSIIINGECVTLFANWIDRKQGNANDIPYKFNLLYRASRDGNSAAAFHAKCDKKGATIVVVKIKNSNQIVGGYNPLFWDSSNSDKPTKDSFIFIFSDKNNLRSANVAYSNGNQYSIRNYSYCGPLFGYNELFINYNINPITWCYRHTDFRNYSYPTLNLSNVMNVDDYEVFQVIKK